MRVLHTSDWHLGITIGSVDRTQTRQAFLDWLLETIRREQVDMLIVAGDIFDTTTPPHSAQNQYYSFLASLAQTGCRHAVITAGNHDSPSLINAPAKLLSRFGVHAVGTVGGQELFAARAADGSLEAVVAAVPYLRERDVFRGAAGQDGKERDKALAMAIGRHYEDLAHQALELMGGRRVPLIATGHLFVTGAQTDGTVRDLYIGHLGNIPSSIFPRAIDYLALGHLHRPQIIGADPTRAYSGSPLPLDFSEASSAKSVRIIDFDEDCSCRIRVEPVPEFDRLASVSGTREEILAQLQLLAGKNQDMLVQVIHTGPAPEPRLAEQVALLAQGTRLTVVRTRDEAVRSAFLQGQAVNNVSVSELTPQDVFSRRLDAAQVCGEERQALQKRFESVLLSLQQSSAQS